MSAEREAVQRHFNKNPYRYLISHLGPNRAQRRAEGVRRQLARPAEDRRVPTARHTLGIPKASRQIVRNHRPLVVPPAMNLTYTRAHFEVPTDA